MTSKGWLACATLCATTACGDDTAPTQTSAPAPVPAQACPEDERCDFEMEVGTGTDSFELLTPNDEVVVALGPQGGFHVWMAARCQDCSKQVLMEYGVRGTSDGAWLYRQSLKGIVNLEAGDDGWLQVTSLFGLLPGAAGTIDYTGLDMLLDVRIEDGDRTSHRVVPVTVSAVEVWDCPAGDPAACE